MASSISDHTHLKIIEITLQCELAQTCKISVHSIYPFLTYIQFQIPVTRLAKPISDLPNQKIFDQLLISVNLYQHAKNRAISLICSGDWLIKRSCNLIGWEHFDPYPSNKNFCKYGICAGTKQITLVFIWTNSVKINDHISL